MFLVCKLLRRGCVFYPIGCREGAENAWVCHYAMEGPKVDVRGLVICASLLRWSRNVCLTTLHVGVGLLFSEQGLANSDLFGPEGKNQGRCSKCGRMLCVTKGVFCHWGHSGSMSCRFPEGVNLCSETSAMVAGLGGGKRGSTCTQFAHGGGGYLPTQRLAPALLPTAHFAFPRCHLCGSRENRFCAPVRVTLILSLCCRAV